MARPLIRRLRATRRTLGYLSDRRLHPSCVPLRAYWWTGHANFGDELTRVILPMYGIAPLLKPFGVADFFGVGSIIELIPPSFSGWIWGSGKMHQDEPTVLPDATVLAVRGAFTRELMSLPADTPLGDPGLLVSRRYPRARRNGRIAVVPHFTHRDLPALARLVARLGDEAYRVDVTGSPRSVIAAISGADAVVSTSLHGLVVADAYGIPALWALPEPTLAGGGFKFADHESVVLPAGNERRVGLDDLTDARQVRSRARAADPAAVDATRSGLDASLARLVSQMARRVSPFALAVEQFRP